jgi:hypothetical protein
MTQPTTIAPEVIACIAEGRDPTITELNRVAEQIWSDVQAARPAFAWGEAVSGSQRLLALKVAQAALTGDAPPDGHD